MKAKAIWANFSVRDAKRTREFYSRLSFISTSPGNDSRLVSVLFGDADFVIHFFEQGSQIDEYLPSRSEDASEVIFTLSAETETAVKEWEEQVRNAGGTIISGAGRDENHYYGFSFADPDGHKFNVLLMDKIM